MKNLRQYILEANEDDALDDMINDKDTNDKSSSEEDNQESDDSSSDNKDSNKDKEKTTERGKIKYTIWIKPDKKVNWLEEGQNYQKIEYKHIDKKKNIYIDFLLGYVEEEKTWKLWIGKIGSLSYEDDPYCDLETGKFAEAIVKSLDKTQDFLQEVEDEPENWIQFYKNI